MSVHAPADLHAPATAGPAAVDAATARATRTVAVTVPDWPLLAEIGRASCRERV